MAAIAADPLRRDVARVRLSVSRQPVRMHASSNFRRHFMPNTAKPRQIQSPAHDWIFMRLKQARTSFNNRSAERLAHAWHSRRAILSGPPSPGETFPTRRQIAPNRPEKSLYIFQKVRALAGIADSLPTDRHHARPPAFQAMLVTRHQLQSRSDLLRHAARERDRKTLPRTAARRQRQRTAASAKAFRQPARCRRPRPNASHARPRCDERRPRSPATPASV